MKPAYMTHNTTRNTQGFTLILAKEAESWAANNEATHNEKITSQITHSHCFK